MIDVCWGSATPRGVPRKKATRNGRFAGIAPETSGNHLSVRLCEFSVRLAMAPIPRIYGRGCDLTAVEIGTGND